MSKDRWILVLIELVKTDKDDTELWEKINVWAVSDVESDGDGGVIYKDWEQKKLINLLGDVNYQYIKCGVT